MSNNPMLVVLTPVRNEAWILDAFLMATSLWADYIIIADQMSTDGSRAIYEKYPKVIVVDNDNEKMHMSHARQLLFETAKKIEGDKILFAMDADEFLVGNFEQQIGWQRILNSKPNEVFSLRWMNLQPGLTQYTTMLEPYYWIAHVSEEFWQGEYPELLVHEWRMPWPEGAQNYDLYDLYFMHFAHLNPIRQANKEVHYQIATAAQGSSNAISIHRFYKDSKRNESELLTVPSGIFNFYKKHNVDLLQLVKFDDPGEFINMAMEYIQRDGVHKYGWLDVWDNVTLRQYIDIDPRTSLQRLLHSYLRHTQKYKSNLVVRAIDKCLRPFFQFSKI